MTGAIVLFKVRVYSCLVNYSWVIYACSEKYDPTELYTNCATWKPYSKYCLGICYFSWMQNLNLRSINIENLALDLHFNVSFLPRSWSQELPTFVYSSIRVGWFKESRGWSCLLFKKIIRSVSSRCFQVIKCRHLASLGLWGWDLWESTGTQKWSLEPWWWGNWHQKYLALNWYDISFRFWIENRPLYQVYFHVAGAYLAWCFGSPAWPSLTIN